MASHTVYAGDDWPFETTLLDSDGNAITALDDAWFSIYTDKTTEIVGYQFSDAEMSLSGNVLSTTPPAATTTDIADGSYFLDVKIKPTGGNVQIVTAKDKVKVVNDHTLYDNY